MKREERKQSIKKKEKKLNYITIGIIDRGVDKSCMCVRGVQKIKLF